MLYMIRLDSGLRLTGLYPPRTEALRQPKTFTDMGLAAYLRSGQSLKGAVIERYEMVKETPVDEVISKLNEIK